MFRKRQLAADIYSLTTILTDVAKKMKIANASLVPISPYNDAKEMLTRIRILHWRLPLRWESKAIRDGFANKAMTGSVFLDFTNAFGSAWHEDPFFKMMRLGVRGP